MLKCCNVLLALVLSLCSLQASAHLLKVFAWMEGSQIVGNAYFAGGISAAGAKIVVYDNNKRPLAQISPKADGSFRITVPVSAGYDIEANTGDGHVAHWQIPASEVITAPAEAASQPKQASQDIQTAPVTQIENQDSAIHFNILANSDSANTATANTVSSNELNHMIQTAIAKEVGPLRMALQQSDARAKLSDIIGGLGFIFGIAGMAMWWRSRKS
ncbi:hypothetical protein HR45_14915 [Shewanella mangrovi]|uniref:Nickel transport protein n=1 Tax=Shewanella mangrovi TaxID=1515746 RepID=A0A094J9Y8_9GAMM|nr:hypothetical protein [Shewanella mangrovi]KFZ36740.1 hypothetical protein HR45_14915 [Shewanella mangrovi]